MRKVIINMKSIRKTKENKGITLIALVVTIIVLLILAGITIATLTGNNGIVTKANEAKEKNEIAEEKEQISLAISAAIANKIDEKVEKEDIEKELEKNKNDVQVIDFESKFIINFLNSKRFYEVDLKGNIYGPQEKIEDKYAGDITKGGTLTGKEESPYQINCIEDLVALAIATNGGNTELGIASSNYSGCYIILMKDLDFNSYFSYNDYSTTKYGDLNKDGLEEKLYIELTKKDDSCFGFPQIGRFSGNFNGKNKRIDNLYQHGDKFVGLFSFIHNGVLKNLKVTGDVTLVSGATGPQETVIGYAGGIVSQIYNSTIYNCVNYVNVTSDTCAGGIVGGQVYGHNCCEINSCVNYGAINAEKSAAGGIIGYQHSNTFSPNILNCSNFGNISSIKNVAGGIIGSTANAGNICNSYNLGQVSANASYVGGIFGKADNSKLLCNNYNNAKLNGKLVGGIFGNKSYGTHILKHNFYLDNVQVEIANTTTKGNPKDINYLKSQEFVNELNSYIESNQDEIDTKNWAKWILGSEGYPILDLDTIWNGNEWINI